MENVCKTCHRILEGTTCPVCGSSSTSTDWSGYVIILDPKRSEIAKRLNVSLPGKYALKVR
ncbi:MAG: transcription elongation factor subunit Spt4 [Halobacteriota archaeon]|nr:transcription elongation factor subunit Spt4 [Halobacteriota archaeon]